MRRQKAPGVAFAYEGLQPTSEASDKKLTSLTGEGKETPSRSWATEVHRLDKLVTSSEETRMSQSVILWRMAEMGAKILIKTWCEGVRPKQ